MFIARKLSSPVLPPFRGIKTPVSGYTTPVFLSQHGGAVSRLVAMSARSIYVKGDPETQTLGDCPFCHRILLTLETKGLDYDKLYVDFANKPEDLFIDNPDGKVPVLIDEGKRIPDSGAIAEYLAEKYPDSMSGEASSVAQKLFPSFVQFLKAAEVEASEKEAALVDQLQQIDTFMKEAGPFLSGSTFGAADAMMVPRLYHMATALAHFRGWTIPETMDGLKDYIQRCKALPAFEATDYGEAMIIKGWSAHLAS